MTEKKEESTVEKVSVITGQVLKINTSSEACQEFGLNPGQKVGFEGSTGVVVGVASLPEDEVNRVMLWVSFDTYKHDEVTCFLYPATELKKL